MSIPMMPEIWDKNRPLRKYLTEKEMHSLHPTAVVMADYWTNWHPKTCNRMKKEGTNLAAYFDRRGDEYADMLIDLMQNGMAEDGAWECVKEEMFLPPER